MLDVIVQIDMNDPSGLIRYQKREFNAFVGMKIPLSSPAKRELPECSGVYCLLGGSLDDGRRLVYVGQTTNLHRRLCEHARNPPHQMDWHTALCFAKEGMSETGLLSLERELTNVFRQATQFKVETEKTKATESLGLEVEPAIREITLCLAAMGVDCVSTEKIEERAEKFYCDVPGSGNGVAIGFRSPEGFVVKKDSFVSKTFKTDFKPRSYWMKRQALEEEGIIKDCKLTEDCSFASPSAAAAAVRGCSSNGRAVWYLADNAKMTLGEYLDKMEVSTSDDA